LATKNILKKGRLDKESELGRFVSMKNFVENEQVPQAIAKNNKINAP